ncbi:MAG TPA: hypothetical protein VJY39_12740 [Acidisphaera sp.]|nr:hypothetical protein [Acidisphaera sp.]HME20045.1 hypothetical protein [Acetobacteraceae bacterium]
MPNDISVAAIPPPQNDPAPSPAAQGGSVSHTGGSASSSSSAPGSSVASNPNPSLHLDQSLGLVVLEFYNDAGAVTRSIPSAGQLDAYRRWLDEGDGPNPLTQAGPL